MEGVRGKQADGCAGPRRPKKLGTVTEAGSGLPKGSTARFHSLRLDSQTRMIEGTRGTCLLRDKSGVLLALPSLLRSMWKHHRFQDLQH